MADAAASMRKTIEAVWRIESAKLIGGLTRVVRDVGLAEDLAQEALVEALERWPEMGIPDKPGAWLMTTAKNRAIDELRRRTMLERKHQEIGQWSSAEENFVKPVEIGEDVGDDVLRLMLIACHPILATEARVALTLRLLGGLTTEEIARAFLVAEPTIAQRIVRAKRTLTEARVPFDMPQGDELSARLSSILEVVYLIFNEGYSATRGEDWVRPELCDDALRLARILAHLVPYEAEVFGLVALLEIQASRNRARTGANGEAILLMDQDRSKWDHLLVNRGLDALNRAMAFGGPLGPYTLQAAIAACHARARKYEDTDWVRIVALYDALAQITQSPVVELNRAVALGMAFGAEAGLELVDELMGEPLLQAYHLLPAVRGDLLCRLGRLEDASREFERAAFLTKNTRERALLLSRVKACR